MIIKVLCPRCSSSKTEKRVSGGRNCTHCGQSWKGRERFPSEDQRFKDARRYNNQHDIPDMGCLYG